MNVGIPTEIKSDEQRVSLTPAGVAALRTHGHRVMVQAGAGVGSGFADRDYRKAGASIASGAAGVWLRADMVLKVKEPQPPEYPLMRPGQIVFTYLHLAADAPLSRELIRRRVAAGVGAEVTIMDINPTRLRYLGDLLGGRVTTVMSNRATLEEEVTNCDLVIGAVLVPGARAPRLLSARMVARMRPGAAIVDLSIDQGGIAETSAPTTHARPTFIRNGVVHYCVTNMPAMVPHTSTYALTHATLTYALEIADHGILEAGLQNAAIRHGLNTYDGRVVHPAVAQALKMKSHSPWK